MAKKFNITRISFEMKKDREEKKKKKKRQTYRSINAEKSGPEKKFSILCSASTKIKRKLLIIPTYTHAHVQMQEVGIWYVFMCINMHTSICEAECECVQHIVEISKLRNCISFFPGRPHTISAITIAIKFNKML